MIFLTFLLQNPSVVHEETRRSRYKHVFSDMAGCLLEHSECLRRKRAAFLNIPCGRLATVTRAVVGQTGLSDCQIRPCRCLALG